MEQKMEENHHFTLIDVRTLEEYQSGYIKGAKLYPLGNEEKIAHDFGVDQKIILVCRSGHRSQVAANDHPQHATHCHQMANQSIYGHSTSNNHHSS